MPSIRSILLLGGPLLSLGLAAPKPERDVFDTETVADWEDMLKTLPGGSLRAAMSNLKPKYRKGVFEDGHDAMSTIYSDDPDLASKLVDLAKQDAIVKEYPKKRQNDNTTASSASLSAATTSTTIIEDSTTSTTVVTTETSVVSPPPNTPTTSERTTEAPATTPQTTQTGVIVPIEISTTAEGGSVVVTSTEVFQTQAPTTIPVEITTTNDNGETITTSTMAPAAIITSTNEGGSVVTTTQPLSNVAVAPGGSIVTSTPMMVTTTDSEGDTVVLSRPTPGGVYTTTDASGSVAVVTYRPGGRTISQLRLQTTTLPNGQQSTITSFEVVGGATDAPTNNDANPSETGTPNLQNGATTPSSFYAAEVAMLIGGAIGVAEMIW